MNVGGDDRATTLAHRARYKAAMSRLAEFLERYPQRAFLALVAAHLLLWTALPATLYPNLPLDLIEALTYGREWQLGHDKLPPLPWWLVEVAHRVIGHDFAYYALAQVAVVTTFAVLWAMARPLVGAAGALAAILILDGLHYFHYTAAKFNHDVIQLPFWALAGFAFHRALRAGSALDWLLLGLGAGLALWAKYFVVILAVPLALFVLLDPRARHSLRRPGPYVAIAAGLLVVLPHLVWLVRNDFLPFAYADLRSSPAEGLLMRLFQPAEFAVSQFAFLLPSLLIAAPLLRRREGDATVAADAYDRRIVGVLAFGPIVTLLVLALASGRSLVALWGYPLWLFLGLWLVMVARVRADGPRLARMAALWLLVFGAAAAAFAVNYGVLPRYDDRYRAVLYPGARLAQEISARFRAATGQPLAYVIAKMWAGGNVGHYAPERPRVLIDGDPRRAPWIDLADLRRRGAAVVWTDSDPRVLPEGLRGAAAGAEVQPPFSLPFRSGGGGIEVGWAILRPQP
jgi:4-amino-4-deoxy-L-arabinose transferase-like glycosyltransferase